VPEATQLDCGAFAAVAVRLIQMRGAPAIPVQLILRYPRDAAAQWRRMWEREGLSPAWIVDEFCYHEACGLMAGERLLLWDPTENQWLDAPSSTRDVYESITAIRLGELRDRSPTPVGWSGLSLHPGVWQILAIGEDGTMTSLPKG
jgi:hypothetical protein